MSAVLVTGASGNVGAPLVGLLTESGMRVVTATNRQPSEVGEVHFDFTDRSTWPAALDGVDRCSCSVPLRCRM